MMLVYAHFNAIVRAILVSTIHGVLLVSQLHIVIIVTFESYFGTKNTLNSDILLKIFSLILAQL